MVGAPGTSPFNELPPELFELIAEHSDTATLRALRLTCRDFAAKVLSTYGQAHFTSRSLLLFKLDSIQTAARAAEHPVFGRHLRQLVIIVDDVVAYPGKTHFTTHWTGWDAPWTQVLSAVREAGVETLSMAIKAETWMLQMSNQSILAPSRALFLDALQHMRHLDVHVAALRDESDYEQGARDFLSIISSAKTLETFKVRMQEGLGRRIRELPYLVLSQLQAFIQRNPNLQRLDLLGSEITPGAFSDEYLDEFEGLDQSDVPDLVREFIDLPGQYEGLWSDDVYVKFERVPRVASPYDSIFL
ncbi:uncharacterized protein RHO25_003007 [Cercospora beticola]|uniref:F-box domain-containing protein n=1 Tax=Cercospora beticola TaxID=122368 RepID=A0ABZ0NFS9_CERBT|nr:hypothetical protein RHO25_003007 [Cercospora beticola]